MTFSTRQPASNDVFITLKKNMQTMNRTSLRIKLNELQSSSTFSQHANCRRRNPVCRLHPELLSIVAREVNQAHTTERHKNWLSGLSKCGDSSLCRTHETLQHPLRRQDLPCQPLFKHRRVIERFGQCLENSFHDVVRVAAIEQIHVQVQAAVGDKGLKEILEQA